MNANDSRKGFSLVELMVAMLATSIMAIVVGSMLFYSWLGWKRNNDSVNMQRDSSLAMRVIAREIRRTPIEDISDGTTLTCVNPNGTFIFSTSGGNLNLQIDSGTLWPLVRKANAVLKASKDVVEGSVEVALSLNTDSDNSTTQMKIFTRN